MLKTCQALLHTFAQLFRVVNHVSLCTYDLRLYSQVKIEAIEKNLTWCERREMLSKICFLSAACHVAGTSAETWGAGGSEPPLP